MGLVLHILQLVPTVEQQLEVLVKDALNFEELIVEFVQVLVRAGILVTLGDPFDRPIL